MIRVSMDLSISHAKKAAKALHNVDRNGEYQCEVVCDLYRRIEEKIAAAIMDEYHRRVTSDRS